MRVLLLLMSSALLCTLVACDKGAVQATPNAQAPRQGVLRSDAAPLQTPQVTKPNTSALPPNARVKVIPESAYPPIGEKVEFTEAQWKERLNPSQYNIMVQEGTERPFTSPLLKIKADGVYHCAACEAPLFASETKYKSGTGWPSYYQPIADGRVGSKTDMKLGVPRTEVHCARCGGHLGHVFNDGPKPTGKRYCINGESLLFSPAPE